MGKGIEMKGMALIASIALFAAATASRIVAMVSQALSTSGLSSMANLSEMAVSSSSFYSRSAPKACTSWSTAAAWLRACVSAVSSRSSPCFTVVGPG